MIRVFAILFGIVFVAVGVLGFIPRFAPNGMLLGIFMVDPLHNAIHLVSGLIALMAAVSEYYAQLFFRIFGIIYALVAIAGFVLKGDLYFLQVNLEDNLLHVGIAVVSLLIGFGMKRRVEIA